MKISVIWMISLVILLVLAMAVKMVNKKMTATKEKWKQFECGFNVMNPSNIPFSFQFFLIALLFLIFDVEIALMVSYPLEMPMVKNMILIFLFLLILTMGFAYEWQKGKISWAK